MELTEEKKQILEAAVRLVLVGFLNKDEDIVDNFNAIAHNINVGGFGHNAPKIPIEIKDLECKMTEIVSDLTADCKR
jgi:hypothetical protein